MPASPGGPLLEAMAGVGIRAFCRAAVARRVDLDVAGLEHVPRSGPILIASRHYHHFYDAAVLMTAVPRPLHFLVALDWVPSRRARRLMEWACATARWPALLRAEQLTGDGANAQAYDRREAGRYLRRAVAESVALLRSGRALVVFPEAYPTIDPEGSPKRDIDTILPFRPGFARLVSLAERDGITRVPIVSAGFSYRPGPRWRVSLRFGPAISTRDVDPARLPRFVEEQVRVLSRVPIALAPALPRRPVR